MSIRHRFAAMSMLVGLTVSACGERDTHADAARAIGALRGREDLIVLFVLIDTLRADRLGAYGYERPTSPNLDRLAREGIRFARTISQSSWTKSSMASLWTATYPARNGVLRYSDGLPPTVTLPAEILSRAGYRTVGLWRNGWVAPSFGFDRGFASYHQPGGARPPESPSSAGLPGTDQDVVESALELLRGTRDDERLFLYLHLMDVHQYVYDATVVNFGSSYSDIYDSSIGWVDHCIGGLLAGMADLGLLQRTLIVVGSDHGEGFEEHGFEGHARTLYREVTEVPWILRLPTPLEEGIVVEGIAQNVDVWPTVLDLLGLMPLPGAQGRSQVPRILSRDARGEEVPVAYAHLDRSWGRVGHAPLPMVAVVRGEHRLIYRDYGRKRAEFFDRLVDPLERRAIQGQTESRRALVELAREYLANASALDPSHVDLDHLQLGQLRALGYVLQPGERPPGPDED